LRQAFLLLPQHAFQAGRYLPTDASSFGLLLPFDPIDFIPQSVPTDKSQDDSRKQDEKAEKNESSPL
jgi:hypothetical protein